MSSSPFWLCSAKTLQPSRAGSSDSSGAIGGSSLGPVGAVSTAWFSISTTILLTSPGGGGKSSTGVLPTSASGAVETTLTLARRTFAIDSGTS